MHVHIVVVSNRHHNPKFVSALLSLALYSYKNATAMGIEAIGTTILSNVSILPWGRQDILNKLIADNKTTHLLTIDDDMLFPNNCLEILLSRKVPFIGVNALLKNPEYQLFTTHDLENRRITSKGRSGIEEVSKVGFGMFLIDIRVIKNIPQPHFEIPYDPTIEGNFLPEDFYFCKKVRGHGHKVYVDHDASQNIGHIGDYVYNLNSFNSATS